MSMYSNCFIKFLFFVFVEDLLLHLEEDISKEEEEITEEPYNYKSTIKVATNC